MAKYKLSDGRTVVVPDGDEAAYQTFQNKLKEKNLTAEIIEEPGKQESSSTETEMEQAQINETGPSQNNPQENTESSSEDGSLESPSETNYNLKGYDVNSEEFINSSPDETLTYENAPEWFNNKAKFHDDPRWNDRVRQLVYNGTHGFNPATGALVKLDKEVNVPKIDKIYSKNKNTLTEEETTFKEDHKQDIKRKQEMEALLNPKKPKVDKMMMNKNEDQAIELLTDMYTGWGLSFETLGLFEDGGTNNIRATSHVTGESKVFSFGHFVGDSHMNVWNLDLGPEADQSAIDAANDFNAWIETNSDPDGSPEKTGEWLLDITDINKDQRKETNKIVNETTTSVNKYADMLGIGNKPLEEVLHIWASVEGDHRGEGNYWFSDYRDDEKFGELSRKEMEAYLTLLTDYKDGISTAELMYDNIDHLQAVIDADNNSRQQIALDKYVDQKYGGNYDTFYAEWMDPSKARETGFSIGTSPLTTQDTDTWYRPTDSWVHYKTGQKITQEEAIEKGYLTELGMLHATSPITKFEYRKDINSLYKTQEFKDILNNLNLSKQEKDFINNNISTNIRHERDINDIEYNMRQFTKNMSDAWWSDKAIRNKMLESAQPHYKELNKENKKLQISIDWQNERLQDNIDEFLKIQDYLTNIQENTENAISQIAEEEGVTNIDDFFKNENAVNKLKELDSVYTDNINKYNVLKNETIPLHSKQLEKDLEVLNEVIGDQEQSMLIVDALQRNHAPGKSLAVNVGASAIDMLKTLTFDLPDAVLFNSLIELGVGEDTWWGQASDYLEGKSEWYDDVLEGPGWRGGNRKAMQFNNISNFEDLCDWGTDFTSGQAPLIATMVATGGWTGLGIMGAYSGAGKYRDLKDHEKMYGVDIPGYQMYFNAITTGVVEAASEKITLGQFKWFKRGFMGKPGMLGFDSAIKRKTFSWNRLSNAGYRTMIDGVQEGGSEVFAGTWSRSMDKFITGTYDGGIWDGWQEEWIGGKTISLSFKTPMMARAMMEPFQSADANQQIATNAEMVINLSKEVQNEMPDFGKPSPPETTTIDGKEIPIQRQRKPDRYFKDGKEISEKEHINDVLKMSDKEISELDADSYANPLVRDLIKADPKTRKKIAKIIDLIDLNTTILENEVKRVDMLTPEEKQTLIEFNKLDYKARQDAEEALARSGIYEGMSDTEIQGVIETLQNEVDARADQKDKILKQYSDKATQEKYMQTVNEVLQRQAEEAEKYGAPKVTIQEVNQQEFEEEVSKYEFKEKQTLAEDIAADADGMVEAMDEIINDKNSTQEEIDHAKELKNDPKAIVDRLGNILTNDSYGVMQPKLDKKGRLTGMRILINKDTALEDNKINTAAHEFIHALFYNTLKQDPQAQMELGDKVIDILNGPGVKFSSRQKQRVFNKRIQGQNGEEVMAITSEMMMDGDIKLADTPLQKMKNFFNGFAYSRADREIKFDTKADVRDFMKRYHESIKNNKVDPAIAKMMAKGANGKIFKSTTTPQQRKDQQKFSENVKRSTRDNPEFRNHYDQHVQNPDKTSKYKSKKEFDGSVDQLAIYEKIEASGKNSLDGMIKAGMQWLPADVLKDFVRKVKEEVTMKFLREFDPTKNNSVFGWMTGVTPILHHMKTKVKEKYLEEEGGSKKRSLDRQTSEGQSYADVIEADKDALLDQIENADMSTSAKRVNKNTVDGLIMVMELLGLPGKVKKAVRETVREANVPLDNLTYRGIRDLLLSTEGKVTTEKKAVPTGPLFGVLNAISAEVGVDPLRILAKQDLNGEQRKIAQQWVFDKAVNEDGSLNNNIIKALPEGTDVDGKATGVASTKLGQFYTKGKRAKMKEGATAAGLAIQNKRTDITKEEFLQLFGINPDGSLIPGTKADGAIRELVVQISQLAANQEIRLNAIENELAAANIIARIGVGKSQQMFSTKEAAERTPGKALQDKHGDFFKLKRTVEGLFPSKGGKMKVRKLFDLVKVGATVRTILDAAYKELGPEGVEVFRTAMVFGLGRSTFGKVGVFKDFAPSIDMVKAFMRVKFGENYQSKNIKKLENGEWVFKVGKEKLTLKQFEDMQRAQQGFLIKTLDFMNTLKGDAVFFHERFLLDSSSNMNHLIRTSAIQIGVLTNPDGTMDYITPTREEHMLPQNMIGTMYIDDPVGTRKIIRLAYGQLPLSKYHDDMVADAGYGSTMPDFFWEVIVPRIKEGSLDYLPSGLASIVRYTASGVDLNNYTLFSTGKSIPSFFGVGIQGMRLSKKDIEHIVPFQNHLIEQVLAGNITKAEATKALKEYISLATTMKRSKSKMDSFKNVAQAFSKRVNNAVNNTKKGMSTFDFDDTLAKTKSGVRARVPNSDGQPKPNRKVIFLAGGAGSGKGNVVSKLNLEKQGFKIVNQDISLEWLKKNSGLPENMNDLTKEQRSTLGKLQHQARGIARRKMMKYQGNANGVVVDGTGGSVKAMKKLVDEFQSKGYDVSMLFVDTSLDVALARNRARKERSLLDKIVERNHEAVQNNKQEFKTMFAGRFMEVNTDNLSQADPMPDNLVNDMADFVNSYEKLRLDAEEFASQGDNILERGGEFDFSEFNDVVDGTPGPLLDKARERAKKYGTKDMFVLTARPQASAPAIHEFLKSQGLNIPIENITGLANSTGNAKAEWMLSKFAEGYNDMYFVDDALQNVEAVKTVLDQLDIKSKVVQAFSERVNGMNKEFNDIIQRSKGIPSEKIMTEAEARKRGKQLNIKRFLKSLYIPPSAEDFKGLVYYFLGRGKQGDIDMKFFEETLFKPFAIGIRAWNSYKQNMVNDYKALKKKYPKVKKELNKKIPESIWTTDTAIRVYLWNKNGFEIPGTDQATIDELVNYVNINPDIKAFADALSIISKRPDGYLPPNENWSVESIPTDLRSIVDKVGRQEFLEEWINNKNIIFSPSNLSKIKAVYGESFVEALSDILYRMENGTNRIQGQSKIVNRFTEWINGSVGAIMFFNMRSALLQTMSTVNFINWSDNNIFKASAAFANQPQFWKDFAMLFNSDMLRQRRGGLRTDVSASELTKSFAENGYSPRTVINYLLQIGFTPTQAVDSFAIAFGGASMFRNRYKKYIKEGKSPKEANEQALLDWQEVAESTQQSSREDLISQQQAGPLGRLILAFQNVTMQYGRLTKKALSDLVNGRGDAKTNISKIIYYGAVQNIIFAALQSALAFFLWGDDEEVIEDKTTRTFNQALDSFLRGTGLYGALVSTLKNTAIQWKLQSEKPWGKERVEKILLEVVNLSPPVGSKLRKITNAYYSKKYNEGVGEELGWRIENPDLAFAASLIEAVFNIPLARIVNKANNLEEAITGNHAMWQRIAMTMGWNRWDIGVEDEELEAAKDRADVKNKEKKKIENAKKKEEEKKEKEKENRAKGIKTVRCSGRKSSGGRCSLTTETAAKTWKCFHHAEFKDGMDRDGDGIKEYRCKGITKSGKRCKNKTENKSKKCYAHQ